MVWSQAWRAAVALFLILAALTACGPAHKGETPTVAPAAQGAAAAVTPDAPAAIVVEFWTTDQQPDRLNAYNEVAQRFMGSHHNVDLRIVPKDEATVAADLAAAAQANHLPALVRLGVERLPALSAAGYLDEAAASAVIRTVGIDDFRPGPLEMVTNLESRQQWAIPYDGWLQALWYRKDLFDAQKLAAPATWDQINAACDAFKAAGDPQYALALPSSPKQNYVHQVFEQVAISNNAWPLTPEGKVSFTTPEMVAALKFYTGLQRCSLPAPVTVEQAADAYLRGQAAMLFYSTYIMDDLVVGAQRENGVTVAPSLPDLAKRTAFAAGMVGPGGAASYGQVVALAILKGADPVTQEVARYYLNEGYVDILATAPLGKVPVRQSVAQRWTTLSPIFANYSDATLGHIANGFDTVHRWVLRGEYDNRQRAVVSEIESRLLIPQAIDRVISGGETPEKAAEWLQAQTEEIMGGS